VLTRQLPNRLVRIVAIRDPVVRQILPELGKIKNASGEKARRVLGWVPRTNEDTVVSIRRAFLKSKFSGSSICLHLTSSHPQNGKLDIPQTRCCFMKIPTKRRSIVVALVAAPAAVMLGITLATMHPAAAGPEASPSPPQTQYLPSISDLMIATIQPRHRRLWQAAQQKNWEFAAYEVGNLHGAFQRLGQAHPTEHAISFPDMIASVTEQPFKELESAIQSKDSVGFAKAYADLTDGCNACHQALNHGVVAIRVPDGPSASDQDFSSATP